MENAVVVRDTGEGPAVRTAVVERSVAEAMAINEWIEASGTGRIRRYRITAAGRAALKRLVAKEESARARSTGTADEAGECTTGSSAWDAARRSRKIRYNLAESPLIALARRRDKSGKPFLSDELVAAGERLREDFELAQTGQRTTQNWEAFLTGVIEQGGRTSPEPARGAEAARDRVRQALAALGPGLGDVALRCCHGAATGVY